MATQPRCPTCKWWDLSTQAAQADPDTTGACRRRPPFVDDRTGLAMWPHSSDEDWCAEHEAMPVVDDSKCRVCGKVTYDACDRHECGRVPF